MKFRASTVEDIAWFSAQTEYSALPPSFRGITAHEGGEALAVVGLDGWTVNSAAIHIAAREFRAVIPLWREAVRFLKSTGRKLVYGFTPADRDTCIRLQKALGFKQTFRQLDGWSDGVDMVYSEYRIK